MTTHTEKSPRNWMRIALVVSLAVNLIFVGLIVGAGIKHGPFGSGPRLGMAMGGYIFALPEARRKEVFHTIGLKKGQSKGGMRRLKVNQKATLKAIKADPFDAIALQNAFQAQRAEIADVTLKVQQGLVEAITKMSVEERAEYLAKIEKRMKRRKNKKR